MILPILLLDDEQRCIFDVKSGMYITEILLNLIKYIDITVLLVTHNPELAKQTEIQFHLGGGKLQKTICS